MLNVGRTGASVVLSWPAAGFAGFTVQSRTNLVLGTWQNTGATVVLTNGQYQVTLPTTGATMYYRLKR
jgi:hypothetical protein